MVFVLIFAALALALPLSVEIYKKGADNIVARTGKDLVETKPVASLISTSQTALASASDFAKGSIAIGAVGLSLIAVWKVLALLVKLVLYLF